MRLFLASQDLGNYANVLRTMVGCKNRALVISNARDYYNDETRIIRDIENIIIQLNAVGIVAERMDLRQYFDRPMELKQYIEKFDPGLIFANGGNVICLATALHESGMDEIIRDGVRNDAFVYGGYSSGSMIASQDLSLYQLVPKLGEEVPLHRVASVAKDIYGVEPVMQGLGLILEYIVPHAGRADHAESTREKLEKIEQAGAKAICLNDTDVLVINNDKMEILRG